jgi:hypothetical protein
MVRKSGDYEVVVGSLAQRGFVNLILAYKQLVKTFENLGFANYAMYHAVEHVFPETFARKRMIIDDNQVV